MRSEKSDVIFTWHTCIWITPSGLGCVRCHVLHGADSLAIIEEAEEDQYLNDIEDLVAFSIKNLESFAHP